MEFHKLFVGRDDAYGSYELDPLASPNDKGKLEGQATTKRGQVTKQMYDAHVAGEQSIGIVPIRIDGTVMWFAIDVDTYDNDNLHKQLLDKIEKNSLPLYMTKSKSGGAHLWCFLSEPMLGRDAIEVARQWIKILGLPQDTEVFPKQKEVDKENVGNWINLPFFGDTRLGVITDHPGEPINIGLEYFLEIVKPVAPKDISHRHEEAETVVDVTSDAPPCIDSFEANGIGEGSRNDVMFHVGVFLKRKYPDEWEDKVYDWNETYCDPPLPASEVRRTVVYQLGKKEYQYRCEVAPMCNTCSKKLCKTRKFGVGGGRTEEQLPFRVHGMRKIDSEEPIYFVTCEEWEVRASLDELLDYSRFRKILIKKSDKMWGYIKQQTWEAALTDMMNDMLVEEAPTIVGQTGLTLDLLRQYLEDFGQTDGRDRAAAGGEPFCDGSMAYIQANDFLEFLERRVKGVKHERVWTVLKEEAGAKEQRFDKDNKSYNLWVLPWKGTGRSGGEAF
jgi:hypothetical protein